MVFMHSFSFSASSIPPFQCIQVWLEGRANEITLIIVNGITANSQLVDFKGHREISLFPGVLHDFLEVEMQRHLRQWLTCVRIYNCQLNDGLAGSHSSHLPDHALLLLCRNKVRFW